MRDWKTVRIFISSTFVDMHSERDVLVRKVFPELRQRCADKRIRIIDVDLRWGVSQVEAEQGKIIDVCLNEIERCRPFFVGLLGERYGWIPSAKEIAGIGKDRVEGLKPGHSITAMEILHGALSMPAMQDRAFFYFRSPEFLADVPQEHLASFEAETPHAAVELKRLKTAICGRFPVFDGYPCRWDGVDVDNRPRLGALEEFGRRVLEDLWTAIQQQHPMDGDAPDSLERERKWHEAFVEERGAIFIGRQNLLLALHAHVTSDETAPLLLVGSSGVGKSALLARFAREADDGVRGTFVLPHFIGASPGSTDIRSTLGRLCRELAKRFDIADEVPDEYEKLRLAFADFLRMASAKGRLLLILDGLDQLDQQHRAHEMDWLPAQVPAGVRIVLSATEGEISDRIRRRRPPCLELEIGALGEAEQRDLVRDTLWEFRKRLDERPGQDQLGTLLRRRDAGSPLFLRVCCEELRLFGQFERLTERIAELPETVPDLFDQVLSRLEGDHGESLVRVALSLLACARKGLLERELLDLLEEEWGSHLPLMSWARLHRSLSHYLRPTDPTGQGEIDFFHRQLAEAVHRRYFADSGTWSHWSLRLGDYYQRLADPDGDGSWRGSDPRAFLRLGTLLAQAVEHAPTAESCPLRERLYMLLKDEHYRRTQIGILHGHRQALDDIWNALTAISTSGLGTTEQAHMIWLAMRHSTLSGDAGDSLRQAAIDVGDGQMELAHARVALIRDPEEHFYSLLTLALVALNKGDKEEVGTLFELAEDRAAAQDAEGATGHYVVNHLFFRRLSIVLAGLRPCPAAWARLFFATKGGHSLLFLATDRPSAGVSPTRLWHEMIREHWSEIPSDNLRDLTELTRRGIVTEFSRRLEDEFGFREKIDCRDTIEELVQTGEWAATMGFGREARACAEDARRLACEALPRVPERFKGDMHRLAGRALGPYDPEAADQHFRQALLRARPRDDDDEFWYISDELAIARDAARAGRWVIAGPLADQMQQIPERTPAAARVVLDAGRREEAQTLAEEQLLAWWQRQSDPGNKHLWESGLSMLLDVFHELEHTEGIGRVGLLKVRTLAPDIGLERAAEAALLAGGLEAGLTALPRIDSAHGISRIAHLILDVAFLPKAMPDAADVLRAVVGNSREKLAAESPEMLGPLLLHAAWASEQLRELRDAEALAAEGKQLMLHTPAEEVRQALDRCADRLRGREQYMLSATDRWNCTDTGRGPELMPYVQPILPVLVTRCLEWANSIPEFTTHDRQYETATTRRALLASALVKGGEVRTAERIALDLRPRDPSEGRHRVFHELAMAYAKHGDLAAARRCLLGQTSQQGSSNRGSKYGAFSSFAVAELLWAHGSLEEAIDLLLERRPAQAQEPEKTAEIEAACELAEAFTAAGQAEAAVDLIDRARTRAMDFSDAGVPRDVLSALSEALLTLSGHPACGRIADDLQELVGTIEDPSSREDAQADLVGVLAKSGELARAARIAAEIAESEYYGSEAMRHLALALAAAGRYEDALETVEQVTYEHSLRDLFRDIASLLAGTNGCAPLPCGVLSKLSDIALRDPANSAIFAQILLESKMVDEAEGVLRTCITADMYVLNDVFAAITIGNKDLPAEELLGRCLSAVAGLGDKEKPYSIKAMVQCIAGVLPPSSARGLLDQCERLSPRAPAPGYNWLALGEELTELALARNRIGDVAGVRRALELIRPEDARTAANARLALACGPFAHPATKETSACGMPISQPPTALQDSDNSGHRASSAGAKRALSLVQAARKLHGIDDLATLSAFEDVFAHGLDADREARLREAVTEMVAQCIAADKAGAETSFRYFRLDDVFGILEANPAFEQCAWSMLEALRESRQHKRHLRLMMRERILDGQTALRAIAEAATGPSVEESGETLAALLGDWQRRQPQLVIDLLPDILCARPLDFAQLHLLATHLCAAAIRTGQVELFRQVSSVCPQLQLALESPSDNR